MVVKERLPRATKMRLGLKWRELSGLLRMWTPRALVKLVLERPRIPLSSPLTSGYSRPHSIGNVQCPTPSPCL